MTRVQFNKESVSQVSLSNTWPWMTAKAARVDRHLDTNEIYFIFGFILDFIGEIHLVETL